MSELFDKALGRVPEDVKRFVDHSFDVVNQIHDILEKQGKTQRDLAGLLGKSESEISKWMRGTHNFTLQSIAKIEAALGESIIMTASKASKSYSKVEMVPVIVYANQNKPLTGQVVFQSAVKWRQANRPEIFKGGVKSA